MSCSCACEKEGGEEGKRRGGQGKIERKGGERRDVYNIYTHSAL